MLSSQDLDNLHKSLKPKNKKRNCNYSHDDQEELLILDECLEITFNGLEKGESEIVIPKVKNRTNNKLLDRIKPKRCDFTFDKLLEEAAKLNNFHIEQKISSFKECDDFMGKCKKKYSQTKEDQEQEQQEQQEQQAFVEYSTEIEKNLFKTTDTNEGKLAFSPPKRNKNPILFDELFYSNLDFN
ncbi:hypothetical protein M0812_17566 [Anaeramoeba flamelloides]|uniref:Uncharacterized protein n=1 Tax=Anaeramoeba flamelloides TaxID=1746091 RepID=A0AAV7ZB80_9EUKA|nr:hypothetical protein M0812_17566 [Anaeramoeba flamelloides]